MKFATCRIEDREVVCLVDAEARRVWPLADLVGEPVEDMMAVIGRFGELRGRIRAAGPGLGFDEIAFAAPVPRPRRNVFCVGKNYHEHAHEFTRSGFDTSAKNVGEAVPTSPIIFTKPPESVIGIGQPIRYPTGISEQLDYEAELGVIIGRSGRAIPRAEAYDYVWGYTIINDVTARDLQARHKQWFLGKSLDTFCPMGPWVTTADEVDPANTRIRCWVNEELRQDANTRDLIFDIPTLIATISAGITLYPGDIIATGTPSGVGIGFNPPKFLRPGDRVTITIDHLGSLTNELI